MIHVTFPDGAERAPACIPVRLRTVVRIRALVEADQLGGVLHPCDYRSRQMTAKLTAPLRAAPATVACLAAIALFVVWATDQAGYPLTHWAPGGLALLVLLGIAVVALRGRPRPPVPVLVRYTSGWVAARR